MAKFAGLVGYVTQEETVPGVWAPVEKTRSMKGDIFSQQASHQNADKVNRDLSLNHRVSLVGDAFAFDNYYAMKWIEMGGQKWEINTVEVKRPRLEISLGGLYHE